MVRCPHCDYLIFAASAWSGPEPENKPGILCPECEAFISDDEIDDIDDPGEPYLSDDDECPEYIEGPSLFDASVGEDVLSDEDEDNCGNCESCGGEWGDGWTTCTCEKDFATKNAA